MSKKKEIDPKIQALIDIGIPLKKVVFHSTVLSFGEKGSVTGTPEFSLNAPSPDPKVKWAQPSRTANIWYTPHAVVTEQSGVYKIIPPAQVADTIVL